MSEDTSSTPVPDTDATEVLTPARADADAPEDTESGEDIPVSPDPGRKDPTPKAPLSHRTRTIIAAAAAVVICAGIGVTGYAVSRPAAEATLQQETISETQDSVDSSTTDSAVSAITDASATTEAPVSDTVAAQPSSDAAASGAAAQPAADNNGGSSSGSQNTGSSSNSGSGSQESSDSGSGSSFSSGSSSSSQNSGSSSSDGSSSSTGNSAPSKTWVTEQGHYEPTYSQVWVPSVSYIRHPRFYVNHGGTEIGPFNSEDKAYSWIENDADMGGIGGSVIDDSWTEKVDNGHYENQKSGQRWVVDVAGHWE